MATTLQETVEKLGLENPKVYVGRERLYPVREGLTPSPRAIAAFEQALSSPESLKSSVRIMDGEQVVFKSARGQVEVPLQLSEQAKSALSTAAQPQPEIETQTPQQTYLELLKQSPEFAGVDISYADLQALSLEDLKPLDAMVIRAAEQNNLSRDETEAIIGAASPFIEKSVANIQAAAEQLVTPEFVTAAEQTQTENQAAKQTYLDLLKQHPDHKYLGTTTHAELLNRPTTIHQQSDRYVLAMAYENGLSREELDRVIAQGSPYVQQQLESGSLTNVEAYLTQISTAYQDQLQGVVSDPSQQAQQREARAHTAQVEAQQVTAAARETYFELLQQNPDFQAWRIETYEELLSQSRPLQQVFDNEMLEVAVEQQLPHKDWEQLMTQASPYIHSEVKAGSLSTAQDYMTERSIYYQHRLDSQLEMQQRSQAAPETPGEPTPRDNYIWLSDAFYNDTMFPGDNYSELFEKALKQPEQGRQNDTQVVLAAFRLNQTPEQLQEVLTQSPYVQSQVAKGVALSEMEQQYVAPIVAHYSDFYQEKMAQGAPEENLRQAVEQVSHQSEQTLFDSAAPTLSTVQLNYPNTAQTIDPAKDFRDTVQRGAATLQTRAVSAKENIELAQKNLTTFAKHVKHRGFKAWAADQMPILKQKALEIAAQQGAKLKDWATEKAPIMKEAAAQTAAFVAQQAVKAPVAAVVAGQVGRVVAEQAFEAGKGFGALAWEKFEKATQLVDPDKLDPALKDAIAMFGKNGRFVGQEFDMQQSPDGKVSVMLKDGTPLYADGKVNLNTDSRLRFRLSQIPENLEQLKQKIQQNASAQTVQKKQVESLEFSR